MLAEELRLRKFDVLTTFEPGGTLLGQHLRKAFLETEEVISPRAELLLFAADRAQHVDFLIKPALEKGKIVISDRYADATFAYQGAGRGFSEQIVNQVIDLATGGLKPDLTIFFDLPVEDALGRAGSRSENNRMDAEKHDFYERVRHAYLSIADREPARFAIVPAADSKKQIHERALELVLRFLEKEASAA